MNDISEEHSLPSDLEDPMQTITRWGIRSQLSDLFNDEHQRPFESFSDCLRAAAHFGGKEIVCEIIMLDFDGEVNDVQVHVHPIDHVPKRGQP